jgi:hypothetical protein
MNQVIDSQITQLNTLFAELNKLLDDGDYEKFSQQELLFSDLIKNLLDNTPQAALLVNLHKLKQLQSDITPLLTRADIEYNTLKTKALKQQRNKSKLQAYK